MFGNDDDESSDSDDEGNGVAGVPTMRSTSLREEAVPPAESNEGSSIRGVSGNIANGGRP